MSSFTDKSLTCVTCGNAFVFTAGEQEFHAAKGFANEPRRCVSCRRARRSEQAGSTRPSDDAPHDATAPGDPSTQPTAPTPVERPERRPVAAVGERPGRAQYDATCSACGSATTLPFDPVGNRAVLCEACYRKVQAYS